MIKSLSDVEQNGNIETENAVEKEENPVIIQLEKTVSAYGLERLKSTINEFM